MSPFLRVDDDRFLPGLSMLADTIKKEDVAAVLQINHGGHFAQGKKTFSPSSFSLSDLNLGGLYKTALKSLDFQQQFAVLSEAIQQHPKKPKKMTEDDIKYIVSAYAQAAVRAKKAGFDMVEIHGATGYLPVQFLSPRINNRKDQYGGNLENRMRFPLELVQAVKDAVGNGFPDVPVITTGRITAPQLAEEILREKKADLIGLARPPFVCRSQVAKEGI